MPHLQSHRRAGFCVQSSGECNQDGDCGSGEICEYNISETTYHCAPVEVCGE